MPTALERPRRLTPPDRQEVLAAARRFFDAGLCCAVETETRRGAPGPREETVAGHPVARVRVTGYDPARLSPALCPPPIACSPGRRRGLSP